MRATALLAFTALWGASQAQMPYQPFPDSNAVWTVTYNSSDCYLFGTPQQIYQYEYATDTLITGTSYHQLVRTYSCAGCCGGNVDGYVGALRQDTTARKVFFIPSWGMDEYLLYDSVPSTWRYTSFLLMCVSHGPDYHRHPTNCGWAEAKIQLQRLLELRDRLRALVVRRE